MSNLEKWPELNWDEWKDSCATFHLWTQVIGKVRLVRSPWVNHSWHVPLYLSSRGFTTSVIPHEEQTFEIDLDLIDHELIISASSGQRESFSLEPMSVARFYERLLETLDRMKLSVEIHAMPNEIAEAVPFPEDDRHAAYDADQIQKFWRACLSIDTVFKEFRARFIGKSSPVHFFWGSFDLAVTRFSGRSAPPHPGGFPNLPDWVAREAYSHEVSSAGFWPGGEQFPQAIFYSYAYPTPEGFSEARVRPDEAFWTDEMGEFVLPYAAVQGADSPEDKLMEFLESTYEAAANLAEWDRDALERAEDPRLAAGAT